MVRDKGGQRKSVTARRQNARGSCHATALCCRPYLAAQLQVRHDDRNLRTAQDQDDKDKEKEAKQVVELVVPDCLKRRMQMVSGRRGKMIPTKWGAASLSAYIEDEEQLNKNGAKWQNARKHHARGRVHVPELRRYLTRDLVGGDWMLVGLRNRGGVGVSIKQGDRKVGDVGGNIFVHVKAQAKDKEKPGPKHHLPSCGSQKSTRQTPEAPRCRARARQGQAWW